MPRREPQDQTVVQPILRPAEDRRARRPGGPGHGQRLQQWLLAAGFLILIALAIGVFVYLPRVVGPATPGTPAVSEEQTTAPPPEQTAPPAEPQTIDYLQLAREMDQAEQARAAFEALLEAYEKRGAQEWAGDLFVSARTAGEQAKEQFDARRFLQARDTYDAALAQMQQVADLARRLVKEQLDAGNQALEQGRSMAAQQAFAFALRVEPDNEQAQHGLKRAGTLEQVMGLINTASSAENAGELQIALQRYKEAAELDPDMTAATEGVTRVQNRIASDRFAAAMSEALTALSDGRPKEARAALERARAIRPQAQEVLDGLARAAELERQQAVLEHRREAERLEAAERWKEALEEYEAALKIDPTLAFALDGKARVQPRLAMHEQFELLIRTPSRLLSAAVRDQARALLAEAGKIPSPGPVLSRQVEQVGAALKAAETPVQVVLHSDNQTEVVIHRVGKLGVFTEHRLQLLPGEYVIVGTRKGYRDVRKELTVLPGHEPAPVIVRCEERI